MPLILVDDHDHPCINSHQSKGYLILKNGTSLSFDTLYYNDSCYYLEYFEDDRSTIVITSNIVEMIKYG